MRQLLPILFIAAFPFSVIHGQQQAVTCSGLPQCRQMALDAAMQGEYERFHDLAWRAVQSGPRNDPSLMYFLARAQALSGRPHDALVMLQRLADMGITTDAATNPDFSRTRDLPGWPAVAEAAARAGTPVPPMAVERGGVAARRNSSSPAAAATDAISPLPIDGAAPDVAGRFSAGPFLAAGLAYDAVSRRFVIGDALERKLVVVGLGAEHADDMVRAASAGFDEVVALEIDENRGDLWVASTAESNGESALHRLQLVSGRPLNTYRPAPAVGSARLLGLAVQASGAVVALDGTGKRLLTLARGSSEIKVALSLKLSGATSIAAGEEDVLYVAHDAGIARVDLRTGTVAALSAPRTLDLRRFAAIRSYRNALIGLQTTTEGLRQLVRLTLDAAGRTVKQGVVIDPRVAAADGRVALTITGNDLYYLATNAVNSGGGPSGNGTPPLTAQFIIRRLALR